MRDFKNFDENEKIKIQSFTTKSKSLIKFEKFRKGKDLKIVNKDNYNDNIRKKNVKGKSENENLDTLGIEDKMKIEKITQKNGNKFNSNDFIYFFI